LDNAARSMGILLVYRVYCQLNVCQVSYSDEWKTEWLLGLSNFFLILLLGLNQIINLIC